jgi:V/A-type H+-transporting ATPase subunit A
VNHAWKSRRATALSLLSRDAELSRIVNLVGPEALSSAQRWVLEGAALIKEGVLQQSALDPVDSFCSPHKQFALLDLVLGIYDKGAELIELGVPVQELQEMPILARVRRAKSSFPSDQADRLKDLRDEVNQAFDAIRLEYAKHGEHAR